MLLPLNRLVLNLLLTAPQSGCFTNDETVLLYGGFVFRTTQIHVLPAMHVLSLMCFIVSTYMFIVNFFINLLQKYFLAYIVY